MFGQPTVSVIIIFLNAEKAFFEAAITSVFAQTYSNWELLLVDDGSTNSSTSIAHHYAKQHPERVRYLEHEGHQNKGMSASRNLGICHAKGNYIALLDADDIWLPGKLERQVAILERQPEAAMVYSSTYMWSSWTGNPEDALRDRNRILGVQPDTLIKPPTLVKLYLRTEAETPGTCSVLIRREVVEELGGFVESFRGMYEDQAFFFKLCLKVPVFVESGCWDRYRQHSQGSCQVAESLGEYHPLKPNAAHLNFLNWLEGYLAEQKIDEPEIKQLLKTALLPYRRPWLYRSLKQAQYWQGKTSKFAKSVARRTLPDSLQRRLKQIKSRSPMLPAVGKVNLGHLRRVTPISQEFGFDRGLPVDRYYIERFLANHAEDIQGRVLEIGDDSYTRQFGGDRVTHSDVLHIKAGNPQATIVGDLANAEHIPSNTFDCLILTQTLHLIYEVRAAIETMHRILKPGGTVLLTVPGISQISIDEWKDYWFWSFTALSVQRLFQEVFSQPNIQIETYGNVLAATAFLQGLAAQELTQAELNHPDSSYQVLITLRAVKTDTGS